MNKDVIKKGLEACISGYCTGCPYEDCHGDCRADLQKDALDLITEQEKMIKKYIRSKEWLD